MISESSKKNKKKKNDAMEKFVPTTKSTVRSTVPKTSVAALPFTFTIEKYANQKFSLHNGIFSILSDAEMNVKYENYL